MFRAIYSEGSATLGMVFYGWYDLFAAALVTQFFMAVQIFFNARDAKSAVPLVIAAGSIGATLGGITTGLLAQNIGTPNLLLVAALFVGTFGVAIPFVWTGYPPVRPPGRKSGKGKGASLSTSDFARVFSHHHIRLIAGLVLVTVVVKTLVDYEFNESVATFAGDRDAISSFQGYVFGAINWLPVLILLPLGPLLKRWGVGFAVLMLPVVMLGFTAALAVAFSVWTATLAKAGDATFRYSAERTGREILYVPVPTELKLKAKAYVDMAVEKGFGKALSGLLIFVLLGFVDYRQVAWVAVGLSLVWCAMAVGAKRQYVRALADSIRGRFANLEGGFASLTERSTLAMVEAALRGDILEIGFALDLVEEAGSVDAKHLADELELLLGHPEEEVRKRVLRLLARFPELVSEEDIRKLLTDESEQVRQSAVGALAAKHPDEADAEPLFGELLASPEDRVRLAVLSWLASSGPDSPDLWRLGSKHVDELAPGEASEAGLTEVMAGAQVSTRHELALAAGLLEPGPIASRILGRLLDDEDPGVAGAAIRSAGLVGSVDLRSRLLSKLADPSLRGSAREALSAAGVDVVGLCAHRLNDPGEQPGIRRNVPSVLARIPDQRSVQVLLAAAADRQTSREIRFQALKALNRLRARNDSALTFDRAAVLSMTAAEVEEALRYAGLGAPLDRIKEREPGVQLLNMAVGEAWEDRREATFRLLGLVFPSDEVYRSHSVLTRTDERVRANALEWLERTLGHGLFNSVLPVLAGEPEVGSELDFADLEAVLDDLVAEPGPWLSAVAAWSRKSKRERHDARARDRLDLIEKVFLLQKVDLLQGARSSHLGLLASIAEEFEVDRGDELLQAGDPNDALYVIVRGAIELSGVADQKLIARENTPFGTWSLIDSDPSVVGAIALEPTRLIRITRTDFQDLLADHPGLATGILQGLARRVRSLVA